MDRRTDWPWNWEEEVEWKIELEERDYDFLAELIDNAVEDGIPHPQYILAPRQEPESAEEAAPEKYLVAA